MPCLERSAAGEDGSTIALAELDLVDAAVEPSGHRDRRAVGRINARPLSRVGQLAVQVDLRLATVVRCVDRGPDAGRDGVRRDNRCAIRTFPHVKADLARLKERNAVAGSAADLAKESRRPRGPGVAADPKQNARPGALQGRRVRDRDRVAGGESHTSAHDAGLCRWAAVQDAVVAVAGGVDGSSVFERKPGECLCRGRGGQGGGQEGGKDQRAERFRLQGGAPFVVVTKGSRRPSLRMWPPPGFDSELSLQQRRVEDLSGIASGVFWSTSATPLVRRTRRVD
jgi:hypothetical protein